MTDQEPKIIVDDNWKEQVQQEKEELKKQETDEASAEDSPPIPEASFPILIQTLSTQALASLGYIPDPVTGQPQVNKEMAKHFIDTLAVLEEKTKGNLTSEEAAHLTESLHQLRIAFVSPSPFAAPPESRSGQPDSEDGKSSTIELP
ncbi:MAG: DUF1844 domain-containing protein [Planctomycetota bacterium]